jgi:hypothetical protein
LTVANVNERELADGASREGHDLFLKGFGAFRTDQFLLIPLHTAFRFERALQAVVDDSLELAELQAIRRPYRVVRLAGFH